MRPSLARSRPVLGVVLVLAALLAVPAAAPAAGPPDREEPTGPPRARIDAYVERLRGLIQNTKMRFTNGIVDMDATHDGVRKAGPIALCCSQSLPRIGAAVRGIDGGLRELAACYVSQEHDDVRPAMELARSDLDALVVALRTLATSETESEAALVLGGTTRAFLNLEKSVADLPACDDGTFGTSEVAPGS